MVSPSCNAELQKKIKEDEFRLKTLQDRAENIRKALTAFELYRGVEVKEVVNPLEVMSVLNTIESDIASINRKLKRNILLLLHLPVDEK